MNAVRRETSPSAGFDMKVVITKLPSSGKSVIGPTSWCFTPCLRNAGPTAKPSTGQRDEAADHGAEPERRDLEEHRARDRLLARRRRGRGRGTAAGARGSFFSGSTAGASFASPLPARQVPDPEEERRAPRSRADRDDPPGDDEADEQHDDAQGKADGPKAGAGSVRVFAARFQVASDKYHKRLLRDGSNQGPKLCRNSARSCCGSGSEPVLGPAAVDERADLGAHLDLGRPLPGALLGELGGRVDPELAADELPRRSRGRDGRRAPR